MPFLIDAGVLVCITIAMCGYNLLLTLEAAAHLKPMSEQLENSGLFIGNVNLTTYLRAHK